MNTDYRLMRDLFTAQTERFYDRTALYYRDGANIRQISFGELRRGVFSLGGWLWAQGWHRKHIAIVSKNSYPYIVLLWAILCGDNTGVLVDYRLSEEEIYSRLELADADVVFCDADSVPRLEHCGRPVIVLETLVEKFLWDGPECISYEAYYPEEEDIVLMLFSSGTTGRSKAVMISQRAVAEGVRMTQEGLSLTRDFLMTLPLFHIMSLIALFAQHVVFGVGMFIHSDSRRLLADISYIKTETLLLVPAQMELFHKMTQLNGIEATRSILGENLWAIYTGGAALKQGIAASIEQLGIKVYSGYGMTEVMIAAPVNDRMYRPGSSGYPASGVEIRIDQPDDNGNGEILIRGKTLFSGYYKNPEATAASFTDDGWFLSGDIGHIDDEGYLYVIGRKKNIIILGSGENVSPEELEDQLLRSSLVSECQVFEIDDAIGVEIFPDKDAFSENTPQEVRNAQLKALVKSINAKYPSSHHISRIFLRSSPFEKTALGKIRRDVKPLTEEEI